MLRSLADKAGLRGAAPRQLHVFDPGLPFDHDAIVALAVDVVRAAYADRPDPEALLAEPFTMRQLRHLHEAVGGRRLVPDSFRRQMLSHLVDTGRTAEGVVGRPAALYRRCLASW